MRAYIKRVFAEVLKFRTSDLDEGVTFENFGVDSLVSQNIIHRFEQDLGELPATLLFENLTITELARYLLAEHRERLATLLAPVTVRRATTVAVPAAVTRAASVAEPVTAPASPPAQGTAAAPVRNEAQVQIPTQNDVESQAQSQVPDPVQALDPVQVERTTALDVAVVGLAGRYPGSPDLDTFWSNLAAGTNCVTEVPADRFDWRPHFDPKRGRKQRSYSRWAASSKAWTSSTPRSSGSCPGTPRPSTRRSGCSWRTPG